MALLTTKEVRSVIRQYQGDSFQVYTNKVKDPNIRKVKCYYNGNSALFRALQRAAGKENVSWTPGCEFSCREGIVVTCRLG